MSLADETACYQALRETQRRLELEGDDHDALEQVSEDVEKARRAMEVAWLEQVAQAA